MKRTKTITLLLMLISLYVKQVQAQVVSTLIGNVANFQKPNGVAVDTSGNVYVADTDNNKIRKISPNGMVSTLAGSGNAGSANGTGTTASFNGLAGVAVDVSGNLYITDANNNKIRKISPSGIVTTLAGNGTQGSADGTGATASFNYLGSVAVDVVSNVYVADGNKVRKISPSGVVTTLAGSGNAGSADGTGATASFYGIAGVAVDASGNVYVAEALNNKIRKISPSGVVTTLAGSGNAGSADGTGTATSFYYPSGVAVDVVGNVYVADKYNNNIRKISPKGLVTTLAGRSGSPGVTNSTGSAAKFQSPQGVAVDLSGNVYVTDDLNRYIRKINPSGAVTTLAGSGNAGSVDGTGTAASFYYPSSVAVDASGNVYVADEGNNNIRKIDPSGVATTLAGTGTQGSADGTGTAASFGIPVSIAVDKSGNVYVAEALNNKIRKISSTGVVTTLAGSGTSGSIDGTGAAASFASPAGVAVDSSGNVYVAEAGNNKIRKISPSGVVTTLAGNGAQGNADGIGADASFNLPYGIAVDASDNVYVADFGNNKIRKISPSGVVTTLAGNGMQDNVDGTGAAASFYYPKGVAVDGSGNVYVADKQNNKIRKVNPNGVVTTLAGSGQGGSVDGVGAVASFFQPQGVAVDASGNVYVADYENYKIRKITITNPSGLSDMDIASNTEIAKIYPNPANDVLTIAVSSPTPNYTIKITNSTAQTLFTTQLTTSSYQLNLSTLGAKGLYFIQILDNTNKVLETKKLVLD